MIFNGLSVYPATLHRIGPRWTATLFSDAEGAEDQVEDVVGGGGAGDFVERTQGSVEIEQEHLVGDSGDNGVGRGVERGERVVD